MQLKNYYLYLEYVHMIFEHELYENMVVEFDDGEWLLKKAANDDGFWNCLYQEE